MASSENNNNSSRFLFVYNIVIGILSFLILAMLTWFGKTTADTHDKVIRLELQQEAVAKTVNDIKATMVTHEGLAIELLKLQVPVGKAAMPEADVKK